MVEKIRQGRTSGGGPRTVKWSREDLLECLEIPSPYYLKRGYRPETLEHFGVGTCVRPLPDGNDKLIGWAIIPIFDRPDLPPLGYTARNPNWFDGSRLPKWLHMEGFNRTGCLFNFWGASRGGRSPLILTEGPGCVMRFHEAGFSGAVAMFGSSPTEHQFHIARMIAGDGGRRPVYIAADADDAGVEFGKRLRREISGVCLGPLAVIYPRKGKDFGDASTEEVQEWMTEAQASSV